MIIINLILHRKKFFIFNEDVREAERNDLLRRMIYNQVMKLAMECVN